MITEPSTLATDYLLGALTGWLAWRLHGIAHQRNQRSVRLWSLAFAAVALGSFTGGTYHGFAAMMSAPVASAIWTVTTVAVGLAACLLVSAALTAVCRQPVRRWLLLAVWAQYAGYALWMLRHDDFVYVIAEYGSLMLGLAALQIRGALRRDPGSGSIIGGVAVTIAAAVVQQSGIDLHRNLNHNDLMHLVQMMAVVLLYKGGAKLKDAQLNESAPRARR